MLDHDTCQPTADVVAAIESLRPAKQRPLTREECTTPELRLEYIAQWLEAGAPPRHGIAGFDMWRIWRQTKCGTVCCLAGTTIAFFDPTYKVTYWPIGSTERARKLLGIVGGNIFVPRGWSNWKTCKQYTPAWAARCIRHYQKTGVVNWEATR